MKSRITPCLWFECDGEEAIGLYLSVFPDSRVTSVDRYGEGELGPAGTAKRIAFEIEGQSFLALNGGQPFGFSPAMSLVVQCDTQHDLDRCWGQLSAGGHVGHGGWVTDRFGVSWRVVPRALDRFLAAQDLEASARVIKAVGKMEKIDIATMQSAYEGKT